MSASQASTAAVAARRPVWLRVLIGIAIFLAALVLAQAPHFEIDFNVIEIRRLERASGSSRS